MIYHMYFDGFSRRTFSPSAWVAASLQVITERFSLEELVAEIIKESKEDSFVFIVTSKNGQVERFNSWITKYNLEEYVSHEVGHLITNGVHTEVGPNLQIIVMTSKEHPWHDMFMDDESEEEYED